MNLPGRALVVGLARSGQAAALALARRGVEVVGSTAPSSTPGGLPQRVSKFDLDRGGRRCSMMSNSSSRARACREMRRSWRLLARARSRSGARSSSATGSCLRPLVGVTGTNGKTTTSELLGAMLDAPGRRQRGPRAHRAGRAGRPRATGSSASCRASSSRTSHELRPRVAVLLNLEPDHLDRHGSFEAYRDAKLRIFENQAAGDTAVLPRGFGAVAGHAPGSSSAPTTRCRRSR